MTVWRGFRCVVVLGLRAGPTERDGSTEARRRRAARGRPMEGVEWIGRQGIG